MTLRERARYIRNEAWLRVRTDWPVWAVLAAAAIVGWRVGWHYGIGWGIAAIVAFAVVIVYGVLGPAYESGRREERDRRRR